MGGTGKGVDVDISDWGVGDSDKVENDSGWGGAGNSSLEEQSSSISFPASVSGTLASGIGLTSLSCFVDITTGFSEAVCGGSTFSESSVESFESGIAFSEKKG